jgi:hypothetical protein
MARSIMKTFALVFALAACTFSCSSPNSDACGTITGTYAYTESATSSSSVGSCVTSAGLMGTITISGPGPDHNVTLPNVQGSCPATSSGCSMSAQCMINVSDLSGQPAGLLTIMANWTFSMTGFTGQSTQTLKKPDGTSCMAAFTDTATKQ